MRQNRQPNAITLIELLVAVSIFSTIATVLYASFRGGVVAYRKIEAQREFQQKIRHAVDRMSRDFKNMFCVSNMPFEGYPDSAAFFTTLSVSGSASKNAAKITYTLSDAGEGNPALARSADPMIAAAVSLAGGSVEGEEAAEDGSGPSILLEGVSELRFSYLTMVEKGPAEQPTYEWVDTWDAVDTIPLAAKIEMTVRDPVEGSQYAISKRIWVPAGKPSANVGATDEEPA